MLDLIPGNILPEQTTDPACSDIYSDSAQGRKNPVDGMTSDPVFDGRGF
jgi:hypothetical protein